jgi:iron complex transport system substrate-binding protein
MTSFASAAALFLWTVASVVQGQQQTCDSNSTDFFPVKVSPQYSTGWIVEYYNTYKIVNNTSAGESYLLFQCDPPSNVDTGNFSAVLQVPIQDVGIDETPLIPFLEHLGLVDKIVAFTSDPAYVSSPCLLQSIADGNVFVLKNSTEFDDFTTTPSTSAATIAKLVQTVGFITPFNTDPTFAVSVKVSESAELTNEAIFEWIKYFGVFFNLEEKANEVFAAAQERWQCVSENAQRIATDTKPVVLWGMLLLFSILFLSRMLFFVGVGINRWSCLTLSFFMCSFVVLSLLQSLL